MSRRTKGNVCLHGNINHSPATTYFSRTQPVSYHTIVIEPNFTMHFAIPTLLLGLTLALAAPTHMSGGALKARQAIVVEEPNGVVGVPFPEENDVEEPEETVTKHR